MGHRVKFNFLFFDYLVSLGHLVVEHLELVISFGQQGGELLFGLGGCPSVFVFEEFRFERQNQLLLLRQTKFKTILRNTKNNLKKGCVYLSCESCCGGETFVK